MALGASECGLYQEDNNHHLTLQDGLNANSGNTNYMDFSTDLMDYNTDAHRSTKSKKTKYKIRKIWLRKRESEKPYVKESLQVLNQIPLLKNHCRQDHQALTSKYSCVSHKN